MKQPRNRQRRVMPRKTRYNEYQIQYIHEKLLQNSYPTVESLARELGVSEKCIERNIAHMRTHRKLPIEVSRKIGQVGYYYSEPVNANMKPPLTKEQLMYWLIAHHALAQLPGIPEDMRPQLDKLSELIDPSMMELLEEMQEMFYFKAFAPEPADMHRLFHLTDARRRRKVVTMKYEKLNAIKPEPKTVAPLGPALINGCWYMVVWDMKQNEPRTYMLSRMSEVEITNEKFAIPKGFSMKKHFAKAFIVLGGDEDHDIDVEFDAWAASYIRRRQFMEEQTMEELANGGLRVKFNVGALEEVESWVCWWRHHARVHGPPALVNRLRAYRDHLTKVLDGAVDSVAATSMVTAVIAQPIT